jgi:hypothetical protein
MPVLLIAFGFFLALFGLAVIVAGAPEWAFGLALGAAMIQSGSIVFVGGLILVGVGLMVRELRQIGQRLETLGSAPAVHASPIAEPVEPEVEPSIVPPEIPIPLSHPPRSAHSPARRAPVEEPELRARHWPPYTAARTTTAVEPAPHSRVEAPTTQRDEPPALESATASAPKKLEAENEPVQIGAVVRSGIIGGMAYSLYADGAIEAELPIGTMRFASLEELREHVARTGTEADVEFGGPAQKQ